MSGRGPPPSDSRFQKGKSGNPNGRRPRASKVPSAFNIVMNKQFVVSRGGRRHELTIEEALQVKIHQAAIAGNRPAQRTILKMIEERERAIAERRPARNSITLSAEQPDPANADDALLLLGIAVRDHHAPHYRIEPASLLEPWAVEAAVTRKRRWSLSDRDLRSIQVGTRAGDALDLPPAEAP